MCKREQSEDAVGPVILALLGIGLAGSILYACTARADTPAEVWIVVSMRQEGVVRRFLDERRPTIEACLAEAADILHAATEHPGEFEMAVRCSVVQKPKDPA